MRKMSNHLTSACFRWVHVEMRCFGGDPYFCIDIILHFQSLNLPESLGRWSWKGSSVDSCWFPGIREPLEGTTSSLKFLPFERYGSTGFLMHRETIGLQGCSWILMTKMLEDYPRRQGIFINTSSCSAVSLVLLKRDGGPLCFLLFCCLFLLCKMKYRYVYLPSLKLT